jgi:hypothetical protein
MNHEVTDALVPDEERLRRAEPRRYTAYGPYRSKIDPVLCRASVADGGRSPLSHQCRSKAKFSTLPGGPVEWCRTHSPAEIVVRTEARYRQEAQESEGIHRRLRIRALAGEVCEALLDPARLQEAINKARERKALIEKEGQVHG